MAMTQQDAIAAMTAALDGAEKVLALLLSGSHGVGLDDAFSDIDFVLVADGGASDELAEFCREAISQVGEIVFWQDRVTFRTLINAITADWMRIDVLMLTPEQFQTFGYAQDNVKVLFDRGALFDSLPAAVRPVQPNPKRVAHQIDEFIRILGLLPLVDGRKEYLNGVLGVFHLRNLLVDLMIEETAAPHRGGVLHLNRLITDEQKVLLSDLPPPVSTRDGIISAHMAYAAAFFPRARALAAALDLPWPERFEAALWARLKTTLALDPPIR